MKDLATGLTCLYFLLCSLCTSAQENDHLNEPDRNKPSLFADLPARIPVDLAIFSNPAARKLNNSIRLPFSGKSPAIQGKILSNTEKFDGALQSIVMSLDNREGAVFTLSQIKAKDGTLNYRGRIVSRKAGDCYELTFENGTYILVRKDYNEMIME